jgi:dienelactone hydrolase
MGEPCAPERLAEVVGELAVTTRIPVLWHYAENDLYWSAHHVRAWFQAFTGAGAQGKLVMRPPFGDNGHLMFARAEGLPLWTAALDEFLQEIAF